jgi:N-acyl-D-amino-acid deacylase
MDQGSFGLSSGLEYAPGSYADTRELIEICRTVAGKNGLYSTHMRNEDDTVIEAIDEALRISRDSGVNLQIAHLKAANPANWYKVEQMLAQIHNARKEGIPVNADRYPYIAYGTGMTTFLPLWARQGSRDEIVARLQDVSLLPKIKSYTESRGKRIGGWSRFQISYCFSEKNIKWEGQSIEACAEADAKSPFEFIHTLLIEENLRAGIVGFAMDESNLQKILADPLVMVGSDGSAVSPFGKLSRGKPHPRFYGTFPRILGKYAREEQIFDLGTAVKKMTSMPAEKVGITKRGCIKQGYFADLVIFEPQNVKDKSTFTDPHQFPTGIRFVLVNGVITVENGKHTGAATGKVLRYQMS